MFFSKCKVVKLFIDNQNKHCLDGVELGQRLGLTLPFIFHVTM
jgi:hypothetical protein